MNLASYLIKGEINRFECVHPYIYASYDILDGMKNVELSNKIRDHLISIEDAFVHSQEWTLSRDVSEIKIAFIGSANSGKSALIHFFLTGVYVQDESPEGGRFKKLYFSHSQPQLLLIRDEAGAPDIQLASWADALVVVVSLADTESVKIASEYYAMFCGLRDRLDIPTMLIATQDALITGPSAPTIEFHVRHLLNCMNWCPYYETCAVYGLNVESVFQEIVSRVLSQRGTSSLSTNTDWIRDGSAGDARAGYVAWSSSHLAQPFTDSVTANTLPMQTHGSNSAAKVDSGHGSGETSVSKPDPMRTGAASVQPPSTISDSNRCRPPNGSDLIRPPSIVAPLMPYTMSPDMSLTLSDAYLSRSSGTMGICPPALQLLQPQPDCLAGQSNVIVPADAALHSSWINSKPLPPCPAHMSMLAHNNGLAGQFSSMTLSNPMMGSFAENKTHQPLGTLFQSTNNAPIPMLGLGTQVVLSECPTVGASDGLCFNSSRPEPISCSTMLPGSHVVRLGENNPTGPGVVIPQVPPRRFPGIPRRSEPESCSRFGPSLTPPSLGSGGQSRVLDSSTNEPTQSTQPHANSKRDRPRPQSTGSLSGPLAGLASATLCTMGMNLSGGGTGGLKPRDNLGAGRLIPLKQGYLYKRSTKGLSKDSRKRKKKYVVITEDARLCYHPSKQDYVNSQHGKSIDLTISTIKLPGMAYRMSSCGIGAVMDSNLTSPSSAGISTDGYGTTTTTITTTATAGSIEMSNSLILPSSAGIGSANNVVRGPVNSTSTPKSRPQLDPSGQTINVTPNNAESRTASALADVTQFGSGASDLSGTNLSTATDPAVRNSPNTNPGSTPTVRTGGRTLREAMKRHYKRAKAAMADNSNESQENQDFIIVTADNTQWHFEAPSTAIRDEWIQQIDAVIHHRLRSGVPLVRNLTATHASSSADNSTTSANAAGRLTPLAGRSGGRPLSTGGGAVEGLFKLGGGEDVCGQEEVLQRLSALAGNDCCADCGAPNPEWASLNLVVLICIECSGVHRELGTHISRVRSATLDTWTREHLAVMASFGNTLANSVWEASAPSKAKQFKKPEPSSPRDVRSAWIQNKYLRRVFLPPLPHTNRPVHQELVDALVRRDARTLLVCVALGGSFARPQSTTTTGVGGEEGCVINLNAAYSPDDSRNPLHFAAILGDLASLQLLLWHGADVNATDSYGLTAWSYAHVCHQTACTRLLQMNGCHTVSPLGVPADWLQVMRIPFPLSKPTGIVTGNLSIDASSLSHRAGFQSSDSVSHSCSSSSSSAAVAAAVASQSDADDQQATANAAVLAR